MGKTRESGELLSNNLLTADSSAETVSVGTAITFFGGNTGIVSANSFHSSGASTFTDDVNIGTGATTAFFDVSSGSVGIGTTNPTEKLHVEGNALVNGNLYLNDTNYLSSLPTGNYGSVQINGDGKGGWEGYSIDGHSVFISDSSSGSFGLYDDTNNHWAIRHFRGSNSYTVLYGGNNSIDLSVRGTDVRVENVPLIVNRTTLTGTASQNLQIDGGGYFSGDVGIGVTNPDFKLHIKSNFNNGGIFLEDSSTSQASPYIRVRGKRSDNNFSQSFSGQLILEKNQTNGPTIDGRHLGAIIFGGNYDASPGVTTGMTYGASMGAISEGEFSGINTAPTALVFYTGTVGLGTLGTANTTFGDTESLRINSNNNILIGSVSETGTASQKLQVTSGAYISGDVGIGTTNPDEKLDIRGHIKLDSGPVLENTISGDVLKITSPSGYLEIGPKNTLFSHFFTDRDKYYFNKRLIVDEGIISSYDEDLVLQTNNSSEERIRIKNDTGNVGIGTTNPTAKLDVNGDVSIASTVSIGTTIDIIPYNDLGALSFEGSAGQLFSITNDLTSGSIFSVNDVSGIPSIDVDADGTIQLAPYGSTEYVGIGTTNPTAKLDVRGSLNVTGASTFSGSSTFSGDVSFGSTATFGDNDKLKFGDGDDLQIYHTGSNSIIQDTGDGDLFLAGDNVVRITNSAFTETKALFTTNGAVELYYDNSKKFETTGAGVSVFGTLETQQLNVSGVSTFSDDLIVGTATTGVVARTDGTLNVTGVSTFSGDVSFGSTATFGDNDKLKFGDSDDLQIYHDGSNSYIEDIGDGQFYIRGSAAIHLETYNGSKKYARFVTNREVELYYDGSKKFETTGVGVSIVNGTSDTATIYGPSNLIIDPGTVGDNTGIVRIKGDLFVDGTQTQINSTTLEIADFIVGVATTATSDLLTDGAGIGIGSDKTFLYEHNGGTIPSLKSSENLNVASGKGYQIDQTEVLNATTLGSGVTNSSLTSVGTLTGLSVHDGNITFRDNILFFDNTTFSTFDWQYYQADNGKIIWTVEGTGGPEMELEGDGADRTNTILRVGGYKVWNAGNDGTGSGLDADTLDGIEASSFLRSDVDDITTGQIQITKANSTSQGGGQIYLNGATGNRIDFSNIGATAPAFTTRSVGTKLVLWSALGNSSVDYGLGIEGFTLWYSVPQATNSYQHRWYGGETQLADLKGSGELVIGSTSLTGTSSQNLQVTGGAYISGDVGIGTTNPTAKLDVRGTLNVTGVSTFTGDVNIGTGATTAFFDVSSGSVGIGTINSDFPLHVFNSVKNNVALFESGDAFAQFGLSDSNGSVNFLTTLGNLQIKTGGDGGTAGTNSIDSLFIKSTGEVGIGTDSPGAKLDVNGDIYVGDKIASRQYPTLSFLDFDDDNDPGVLGQSGNNYVTIGSVSGLNLIFDVNDNDNNGLVIGSGDANTTNATKHMVVSGAGNVGIGTTTPTQKLHVEGNALVNGNLYLNDTNYLSSLPTGDYGSVQINGDGKGNWEGYSIDGGAVFMFNGTTSFGLYDDTNNHWAIRHFRGGSSYTELSGGDNSANLSIHGTDVRVENVPLIVNTTTLTGTASQNLQIDGGAYVSGDVGIGTTNPGSTLAVGGTITELYDGSYWNVVTQADVGYGASQVPLNQYLGQLAFLDDYHPNGLRRDGGGSDDVVVNSSGRVGIGTDSPATTLEIAGTGSPTFRISDLDGTNQFGQILANNGTFVIESRNDTSDGQIIFRGRDNTDTNEYARFDENGNLGIGNDDPNAVLDANPGYGTTYTGTFTGTDAYNPTTGEIKIGSDNNAAASAGDYVGLRFSIIGNGSGNANAGIFAVREQAEGNGKTSLAFATRNWGGNTTLTEKVRITSDGNLGIGITNPSAKLDVNGDANISGVVTATSFHGDGSKLTTNYAKFIGTGTTDVNSSTSYGEVSWLNTTPQFSNGTWSATSSHIVVPSTGLYLVQVNLYLIGQSGQRSNVGLKFAVNDVQQSEIAAHDYIRFASGHTEASINMSTTLSLSADDEVSIYTARLAVAGVVELQGTNSTISLTQLA